MVFHFIYITFTQNEITFRLSLENSKILPLDSSRIKITVALASQSGFPMKLVCYIIFGSESKTCSLLTSVAINL